MQTLTLITAESAFLGTGERPLRMQSCCVHNPSGGRLAPVWLLLERLEDFFRTLHVLLLMDGIADNEKLSHHLFQSMPDHVG